MTGQAARCSYRDKEYDLEATLKLICLFVEHPKIKIVYFNDERVQKTLGGGRVKSLAGHNNHFHAELWSRYSS